MSKFYKDYMEGFSFAFLAKGSFSFGTGGTISGEGGVSTEFNATVGGSYTTYLFNLKE